MIPQQMQGVTPQREHCRASPAPLCCGVAAGQPPAGIRWVTPAPSPEPQTAPPLAAPENRTPLARWVYQVARDLDSEHVWFSKIVLSGCLIPRLARGGGERDARGSPGRRLAAAPAGSRADAHRRRGYEPNQRGKRRGRGAEFALTLCRATGPQENETHLFFFSQGVSSEL